MMKQESSIITGKLTTQGFGPGATSPKKLYVKIFLGSFTNRPPRLKQAKVLRGELLVKYSGREWPEKKNGPLYGDMGVISGVSSLLLASSYKNVDDIKYAAEKDVRPLKDTLTLVVGPNLAKEFIDRGMVEVEESLDPMASRTVYAEPDLDIVLPVISDLIEVEKPTAISNEVKEKVILATDLIDLSKLDDIPTSKPVVKTVKPKVIPPKVSIVKSKSKKVEAK